MNEPVLQSRKWVESHVLHDRRSDMWRVCTLILRLVLLTIVGIAASVRARQPEIAARPLGMGEAFLAVADDGNALLWNPAGLPWLDHHEMIGSHANLFNIGLQTNNLGYVFPLKDDLAIGFDWNNLNSNDTGLAFEKSSFRFSCGQRVWKGLSLGLGIRRLQMDMSLDDLSLANGSGWGLDLAALYEPLKQLKVALAVRDLTDTEIRYENRKEGTIAKSQVRLGAAFKPTPSLTLASDVDRQFHLGAEYWHESTLALRAGVKKDLVLAESPTYAAGGSVRYKFFQFDYAYVVPPTLPASGRFSLSLFFDLYTSRVRIVEQPRINPVFPAFARRYAGIEPMGSVTLVNQDNQPHHATLSFYIPGLMETPATKQVVILPKETKEVGVDTVVFSSRITSLAEPRLTQALVKVSYTTRRRTRVHERQAHLFVYSRNHTQWDDVRKGAAFITPLDPVVEQFARPVLVDFDNEIEGLGKSSRNLLRAMVLFEALKQHGVRYLPDPNNPYDQMASDVEAVDHVKYPAEVLRKKTGDCDDLTVLYCALLENVGVHTALVDFPDHIFMMFNTGISYRDEYRLPLDRSLYVLRGDEFWIPVEVTLFGESFLTAWRAAANELAALPSRERQRLVVNTADGWAEYEPSPPPGERIIAPPAREEFHKELLGQYTELRKMVGDFITRTYQDQLQEDPGDVRLQLRLARVYVSIREFDQAIAVYAQLLKKGGDPALVYNNMGLVYFLKDEIEIAARYLGKAVDLKPGDEKIERQLDRAMLILGQEGRTGIEAAVGKPEPGAKKAEEWEVDEDSFYWME